VTHLFGGHEWGFLTRSCWEGGLGKEMHVQQQSLGGPGKNSKSQVDGTEGVGGIAMEVTSRLNRENRGEGRKKLPCRQKNTGVRTNLNLIGGASSGKQ